MIYDMIYDIEWANALVPPTPLFWGGVDRGIDFLQDIVVLFQG